MPTQQPPTDNVVPFDSPDASGLGAYTKDLRQRRLLGLADAVGIAYIDRIKLSTALSTNAPSDAIAIPYYTIDGTEVLEGPLHYTRYRLLNPPQRGGKYRQPPNSSPHAYFPPAIPGHTTQSHPWADVAHDPTIPILITEGEFKALRASITPAFPPTIGLGGVDSFTGGKRYGTPLLAELLDWKWHKRTVYVVFDADNNDPNNADAPAYKPSVQAAIDRLASTFVALGAEVQVLSLAAAARGKGIDGKIGLDDYILAGGLWPELLLTAEKVSAIDEVRYLLAKYGIYAPTGAVVEFTTGRMWKSHVFCATIESHRTVPGEKAPILAAKLFLASPKRTIVDAVGVWPTHPSGLTRIPTDEIRGGSPYDDPEPLPGDTQDTGLVINLFQPPPGWFHSALENNDAYQHRKAVVVDVWNEFVTEFFKSQPGFAALFHQWVAQVVARPGQRNYTSWILQSAEQGIGKSLIAETLARMVGPELGRICGPGAFMSGYNYGFMGKLFVVLNELADDRSAHRSFRNMRTADVVEYEEKYMPGCLGRNLANYLITTNEPVAFRTEEDARRDIVYTPPHSHNDQVWQNFLRNKVVPISTNNTSLAMLLSHYRFDVPLDDYKHSRPAPQSQSKRSMAEQSMPHNESAARAILQHMHAEAGPVAVFTAAGLKKGLTTANIDHRAVRKQLKRLSGTHWGDFPVKFEGTTHRVLVLGMTQDEFIGMPVPERTRLIAECDKAFMGWLQTEGE